MSFLVNPRRLTSGQAAVELNQGSRLQVPALVGSVCGRPLPRLGAAALAVTITCMVAHRLQSTEAAKTSFISGSIFCPPERSSLFVHFSSIFCGGVCWGGERWGLGQVPLGV